MIPAEYTYLLLMSGTILIPLIRSFETRVHYYRKFKYLFPAILIPGAVFIIWDIIFTNNNIWRFNEEFITGIHISALPLEEWMFFFAVPYACVFVYEVINYFFPKIYFKRISYIITILLLLLGIFLAVTHSDHLYTFTVSLFLTGMLILQLVIKSPASYLSSAYVSFLICIIPFVLVNGVLTAMPVVIYNNEQNMALRFFTIPWEDFLYFLVLYLMNINIFEYLRSRYPLKQRLPDK